MRLILQPFPAGADGLIVEVHLNPKRALTDADQTMSLDQFDDLMAKFGRLRDAIDGNGHSVPR
ncbi:MAG: hypothetical protein HY287_10910 [Planctomycetes bacterium]|nr:hypothetical protein [Planctomycetota bacterium]MBI3834829.1 hypothetical protein [Planctomycetota bacterium]